MYVDEPLVFIEKYQNEILEYTTENIMWRETEVLVYDIKTSKYSITIYCQGLTADIFVYSKDTKETHYIPTFEKLENLVFGKEE